MASVVYLIDLYQVATGQNMVLFLFLKISNYLKVHFKRFTKPIVSRHDCSSLNAFPVVISSKNNNKYDVFGK